MMGAEELVWFFFVTTVAAAITSSIGTTIDARLSYEFRVGDLCTPCGP